MRTLLMGLSLSGLLFFGTAWAHTRSNCEIPLIGHFAALVDLGLDRGWLPPERLKRAANSDVAINPMSGMDLDSTQLPLYQAFQRFLPQAREHWDLIRSDLQARSQAESKQQERNQQAVELTRDVLQPRLLSKFTSSEAKAMKWEIRDDQPVLLLDTGHRGRKAKPDASNVFSTLQVVNKADDKALDLAIKKWRQENQEQTLTTLGFQIFDQGDTKIIVRTAIGNLPMSTKSMMESSRGHGSGIYGAFSIMGAGDPICMKESVEIFSQRKGILRREAFYDVGNSCDADTSQCLIRKNGNLACVIATPGRAIYEERNSEGNWSARVYLNGPPVFNKMALYETTRGELVLAVSQTNGVSVFRLEQGGAAVQKFKDSALMITWFERRGQVYLAALNDEARSFIAEPLVSDYQYPVTGLPMACSGLFRPATVTLADGRVLLAYQGYKHTRESQDQIFVLDLFTSMH